MNQIQQFFEYIFNAIKIWVIIQPWEEGLRVRNGKKIKRLTKGIYLIIPYFDSIYVQENRLRVASMPMQTLTTKDLNTISINGAIGYQINNIYTLYQTLYHPETTLINITMSEVAAYVFSKNLQDITPKEIENVVIKNLSSNDYGLKFQYYRITTFAVVKTYRLIQDQSWIDEGLKMNNKQ